MTGAVFRDTVRFTGELDAGTLTVKKIFNGNKYITTKYKYKYKYKYIKNVLKYKYKYQVPHLCYPQRITTSARPTTARASDSTQSVDHCARYKFFY